ncbi:hypothetical protein [Glycomyces tarimensis]
MTGKSHLEGTLQARYPLPDWVVDSKFKQGLTLAVADTIEQEVDRWPAFQGPTAQQDHAEHVTKAVRRTLKPWLTWMSDSITDGFSYPGDVLVSYISQLALTRPGEAPDTDRYRELLRSYSRYLVHQARRFDAPSTSAD